MKELNFPVAELFCALCGLPVSTPGDLFCNRQCEEAWNKYLSGEWSWAQLYEWALS